MSNPIRVLYVDDYPLDRALVRDALVKEHGGFALVEAASREEFEARLADGAYDVVLSDYNILGYDGLSVMDAVQTHAPGVPVILVTGTGSEEIAVEAMRRGAADYVIKTPKHIHRLPMTIRAALDKRRMIAEQAQAGEALRASEQRYRQLVELAQEGIWALDTKARTTYVNPRMAVMLGYTVDEMLDRPLFDFMDEKQVRRAQACFDRRQSGITEHHEFEFRRKDGAAIIAEVATAPLEDAAGRFVGAFAVVSDITRRKQVELALRESEERFRLVGQATQDYIWDWRRATNRVWRNEAFYEHFGPQAPDEELFDYWLQRVHPDDRERVLKRVMAATEGAEQNWTSEYRLRRADGKYAHVIDRGFAVRDAQGRTGRVVGAIQDITQRKQAEAALHESKRLLDATGRMARVGGWELNAETLEVRWTEETYRIHEVPPGHQPSLQEAINFFHPEDRGRLSRAIQRALEEGAPYDMEIRFITAKGHHLWTRMVCQPENVDGKTVRLVGTFQDITDRKRAEDALQQSEARFRRVVEHVSDALMVDDASGRVVFANDRFLELFGIKHEQIGCIRLEDYVAPKFRQVLRDRHDRRVRGECVPARFEYEGQRQDGSHLWLEVDVVVLKEPDGRVTGTQSAIRDITERKNAVEALRQSQERLKLALRGADLGTWDWNVQTGAVTFDKRWAEMLGYTVDEIEPHVRSWEKLLHTDDVPHVKEVLNAHLEGGTPVYETEHRLRHKSGHWVWILDRGKVIERDAAGKPLRACGTHLDITERKRAEEEHRKLEGQLRQAQKLEAVGTLAAGVAHDFNNALMAILGYAEAARLALPRNHKVHADLDGIVKGGEQASAVTKSLLMFSREAAAEKSPVNLAQVVRNVAKMLSRMLPAAVEMTVEAPESDELVIEGDTVQLNQVLVNLAINARDAMQDGGQLRITVSSRPDDAADVWSTIAARGLGTVRLVVEDSGTGMPAEVTARVCDPFFTTKERERGTGLGMAVVHGIVESHRGHMQIESEVGRGTCVTIEFPRCCPAAQASSAAVAPAVARGGGATILVAEDNAQVRAVIASALTAAGYEVIQVADGIGAMKVIETPGNRVRLAILDVDMPKMSGKVCLARIREAHPEFPVIMMSGFYDVSHCGHEIEGVSLLQKPFQIAELTRRVGEMFDVVATRED